MKGLILSFLMLVNSSLFAQQTLQLHFVCGELKADCISMNSVDGGTILVEKIPAMEWASNDIAEIRSADGTHGQSSLILSLTDNAAKKFAELTRANLGRKLAIIVDGKILTTPQINAPIVNSPLQLTLGEDPSKSPLLTKLTWVNARLASEKSVAVTNFKMKMAAYIAVGLLLLLGALYFAFFRPVRGIRGRTEV